MLSKNHAVKLSVAILIFAVSSAFAQITVLVNNIGYELTGPKRAVVQSASAITATEAELVSASGQVLRTITLSNQQTSAQWSNTATNRPRFGYFKVADFSDFVTAGENYMIRVGTDTSARFAIGEKLLQTVTGADQVTFFYEMRHGYHPNGGRFGNAGPSSLPGPRTEYEGLDSNIPIHGSGTADNPVRRNLRGGWWDATGDAGKHLSHLAYSNYFTPQQIPMVSWALLHANELQPDAFGTSVRAEAAWGTDYLLRALAPEGFFYMSIFDRWGMGTHDDPLVQPNRRGDREICAWGSLETIVDQGTGDGVRNAQGLHTADYQSALREGGGVSIAALARAAAMGVTEGDSSAAQYLAGARRAYEHLTTPSAACGGVECYKFYPDNKIPNIIDFYTGLLAATELYNATNEQLYLTEARRWLDSLLSLQHTDGWFRSGNDATGSARPFFHAAEEGFPVVAMWRFYQVGASASDKSRIRAAVGRNLRHYHRITYDQSNPFEYARMFRRFSEPLLGGGGGDPSLGMDLARGKTATASREESSGSGCPGGCLASHAIDGNSQTRWSSFMAGEENDDQWIAVDLGGEFTVTSVALRWEGAFGRDYRIEISQDGQTWETAHEVTGNTIVNQRITHTFATPREARHVRMFGLVRGLEHGGFSLWDFEVYGESSSATHADWAPHFFIPKVNETGYWWQGENARLGSMASAFILGAALADPSGEMWADTLFGMATAQLDWILGRNPFDLTMMYGYGRTGYDHFPAARYLDNIKGGICNGISSARANENNIEWAPNEGWQDWRFVEQWLPHNAWYLTAIASLSWRLENEFDEDTTTTVRHRPNVRNHNIRMTSRGRNVRINLPQNINGDMTITLYDIRGRQVFKRDISRVDVTHRNISLRIPNNVSRGVYVMRISGEAFNNRATVVGRVNIR